MEGRGDAYRKNLVKALRDAPKEGRAPLLRESKMYDNYVEAHSEHNLRAQDLRRSKRLEGIVLKADSFDQLREAIGRTSLLIRNNHAGLDHSEHLLKRLDLVETLGDPALVPDAGGLRQKVTRLLQDRGSEVFAQRDPARYREYLKQRFAKYALTENEVAVVSKKLPADVFGSVDTEIEDSVLILNALPGTKTRFSCSGHVDGLSDAMTAANGYIGINTSDAELVERLSSLEHSTATFGVKIEHGDGNYFTVRFEKLVPEEWITANGKRTKHELFEESKRRLSEILGSELLNFEKDDEEYFTAIKRLQNEYLRSHPEAANMPYEHNSHFLRKISLWYTSTLESNEYYDYFISDGAEKEKNDFLMHLTDVLAHYRQERLQRPK